MLLFALCDYNNSCCGQVTVVFSHFKVILQENPSNYLINDLSFQ